MPPGYPQLTLLKSDDPSPGYVFLSPFALTSDAGHMIILDNLGNPVFYRRVALRSFDFKMQPNGLLTYYWGATPANGGQKFFVMDRSFAIIDSFSAGNGYPTDLHDIQILPNGHALLMSYDRQPVRMDSIVPGGRPNASVIGLIIQEIDKKRRVVFQWRSWDYFAITDARSPLATLTGASVDYVHGNSVERDRDNNLLISCRHMNEITKISKRDGHIIWRMGLNAANNEFTFVNDTRGFSHLHDVRVLKNGHITLFDNGNFLNPQYSRALEYEVDQKRKVATLVWEYRNAPDTYGPFMGNVQRLESGGNMLGWGGTPQNPKLTELHPDGSKAYEVGLPSNTFTYRAFRFPWSTTRFTTVASLDFGVAGVGDTTWLPLEVRNTSKTDVIINDFFSTDSVVFAVRRSDPVTIPPGGSATFDIRFSPRGPGEFSATIYVKSLGATELIARDVALKGTGAALRPFAAPLAARATPERFWIYPSAPNPAVTATTLRFDLPRRCDVTLEIYDVSGRRVDTVVMGTMPAGHHERSWAPKDESSGLFFYRLKAGDVFATGKVAFVR